MKSGIKISFILYAIAALVHVATCYFEEYYLVNQVSKVMLMPFLIVAVLSARAQMKYWALILGALAFSWVGDIVLISEDESFFLYGLGAFFIAHIFYIVAFRKCRDDNHEIPMMKRYPFLAIVIGVGGAAIFFKVKDGLESLELPVLFYTLVIVIMAVQALNRHKKTTARSFELVMLGALLFMVSDSIIALNRFNATIEYSSVWIMLTYCLAQYLIVKGMIAAKPYEVM
jgi:uncharacterized membrane protein YhhN